MHTVWQATGNQARFAAGMSKPHIPKPVVLCMAGDMVRTRADSRAKCLCLSPAALRWDNG
jgi:hypothetical protein